MSGEQDRNSNGSEDTPPAFEEGWAERYLESLGYINGTDPDQVRELLGDLLRGFVNQAGRVITDLMQGHQKQTQLLGEQVSRDRGGNHRLIANHAESLRNQFEVFLVRADAAIQHCHQQLAAQQQQIDALTAAVAELRKGRADG